MDVMRHAARERGRPPARHQQKPGADRTIEARQAQIRPRPLRRERIDPVAGGIGNAGGCVAHRVRTLPLSVSKVLPPFLPALASGAEPEPSTSLSDGPAGPRGWLLHLLRNIADLRRHGLGVLVAVLHLGADVRRDSAFGGVGLDVFDHLGLGLAEIADQLAGLVRRRVTIARRLDQLAALLCVLAERNEGLHAVLAGTALRRRSRAESAGAADGCRTIGRERSLRRSADRGDRRRTVHGRKRGIGCGLLRQRRREPLGIGASGTHGDHGGSDRNHQTTDHQDSLSGRSLRGSASSQLKRNQRVRDFTIPADA